MKDVPQRIYLILGEAEPELIDSFKELSEVTWSADKLYKNDIEYVLANKDLCVMEWKQKIIQAIKEKWIEDFGSLQEEREALINGYFVTGFVSSVLDKLETTPPAQSGELWDEVINICALNECEYKDLHTRLQSEYYVTKK